jgi:hypothetical protein
MSVTTMKYRAKIAVEKQRRNRGERKRNKERRERRRGRILTTEREVCLC